MRRTMRLFAVASLAVLAGLLAPAPATSQTTCRPDYFGGYRCSDSYGGSGRIQRDYFGNYRSTYQDGYGRETRCRSTMDYFGNVRTTCD